MLHVLDELDLLALVDAIPGPVLGRIEKAELALPIPEHVLLQPGQLADLANGEELLDGLIRHSSRSALSSRCISPAMASAGGCDSNSTRCTASAIGIVTATRAARATVLRALRTPSAMVSVPVRISCSERPFPTSTPTARLRLRAPVQVSTRSPIPASPAKVSCRAPNATPSRVVSASPRVMSAARELSPSPSPSAIPVATAITFLTAPATSTPRRSSVVYTRNVDVLNTRCTAADASAFSLAATTAVG